MPATIQIVNASSLQRGDLDHLTTTLNHIFGAAVSMRSSGLDLSLAFDASRKQFHSTLLLAELLALPNPEQEKIAAVVDVDLFVPVLTFVFGEAQLDGIAAIVSTHRLANQFYGIEADSVLLRERLEKELVHELGHAFGLLHCRQFECVMRSSTYVEEIDLKRVDFCDRCATILRQKMRSAQATVPN